MYGCGEKGTSPSREWRCSPGLIYPSLESTLTPPKSFPKLKVLAELHRYTHSHTSHTLTHTHIMSEKAFHLSWVFLKLGKRRLRVSCQPGTQDLPSPAGDTLP